MRCGAAPQHSAIPACSHRSEISGLDAGRPMPHSIDAAVDPQQGPSTQPLFDLACGDTCAKKLRPRNDSVRTARQLPDHRVGCPAFWSHCDHK